MSPYANEAEVATWQEGTENAKAAAANTNASSGVVEKNTTTSGKKKRHKRRKSVCFQDMVTYREISPLAEISEEEIHNVWYSDEEYSEIKKVVTATVKKAGSGDLEDEENGITMRGLEGRTKFGARRRKNNKAAALNAVWETQTSLWRKKIDNPMAIAAAYKPHSTHAKYRALEAAHNDEVFVNEHVR